MNIKYPSCNVNFERNKKNIMRKLQIIIQKFHIYLYYIKGIIIHESVL